ncbi:MAG: hypothetical protein WC810_14570 [Janthinobacterium sp.]|jgi:hypothetical protein
MTNDNPLKFIAGVITLIVVLLVALLLSSCKSCNKTDEPVVNVPETIEAKSKPIEDSLRKEVAVLKDSIAILKKIADKAAVKKEVIRERVVERPVPTTDSGALLAYNELLEDFDQYVVQSDKQATAQGEIIVKQERIITNQLSDIELQKSKYKELATAFTNLNDQYGNAVKELKKSDRKLKRAKVFNKIFGIGTAAGVALAAIIFL